MEAAWALRVRAGERWCVGEAAQAAWWVLHPLCSSVRPDLVEQSLMVLPCCTVTSVTKNHFERRDWDFVHNILVY